VNDFGFQSGEDFAIAMDARDPLPGTTESFSYFPRRLAAVNACICVVTRWGCNPRRRRPTSPQELKDWAQLGVEGHFRATNPM